MKSDLQELFGIPSTAMNPFEREAHYSKIENDRRDYWKHPYDRRNEDRCNCGHGIFWHLGSDGAGSCLASTHRTGDHLIVGQPCNCVEFELQPDRRES